MTTPIASRDSFATNVLAPKRCMAAPALALVKTIIASIARATFCTIPQPIHPMGSVRAIVTTIQSVYQVTSAFSAECTLPSQLVLDQDGAALITAY